MRILYVEDDKWSRIGLEMNLKDRGHEVMTAATIVEAQEILALNEFDKIICDGTLRPGENDNGVRFAVELNRQGKKVVVFSADTRRVPRGVPCLSKHEPGSLSSTLDKLLAL